MTPYTDSPPDIVQRHGTRALRIPVGVKTLALRSGPSKGGRNFQNEQPADTGFDNACFEQLVKKRGSVADMHKLRGLIRPGASSSRELPAPKCAPKYAPRGPKIRSKLRSPHKWCEEGPKRPCTENPKGARKPQQKTREAQSAPTHDLLKRMSLNSERCVAQGC